MLYELIIALILSLFTTTAIYTIVKYFKKKWKIYHPKNTFFIYIIVLATAASIFPFTTLAFSTSLEPNHTTTIEIPEIQTTTVSESTILTENQNITYASSITPLKQTLQNHYGKAVYLQRISWQELIVLDEHSIQNNQLLINNPTACSSINFSHLLQKNLIALDEQGIQTPTLINRIVTNLLIQQQKNTQEPSPVATNDKTLDIQEKENKESTLPAYITSDETYFYSAFLLLGFLTLAYIISGLFFTKKRVLNKLHATPCSDPSVISLINRLSKEFKIKTPTIYQYNGPPNAFVFGYPVTLAYAHELKNCLSKKEFEAAIRHELAHIKNHDIVIKPLIQGLRIFFFYNPVVHIVSHKIMKNREILADMSTFSTKHDKISLMDALIKISEYTNPKYTTSLPSSSLTLFSYAPKKLTLTERFSNLFERATKKSLLTALVALIVLFANVSIFFVAENVIDNQSTDNEQMYTQQFSIDKSYYSESITYTNVEKDAKTYRAMIIQKSLFNIITTELPAEMTDTLPPSLFTENQACYESCNDITPF